MQHLSISKHFVDHDLLLHRSLSKNLVNLLELVAVEEQAFVVLLEPVLELDLVQQLG